MARETDLERILASLDVERRDGTFAFVVADPGNRRAADLEVAAHAVVDEAEGRTLVVPAEVARDRGCTVGFEAVWLTLTVHSALEAVGLTAAVSAELADVGIACNVLAGYHHDHLLVPVERADEAIDVLRGLSSR